ncbi:MAG: hypothetical protein COA79_09640 [Planctomycetota bacterium]|nr:MAG: hypothetical protein COA79_09640 [Planctomycetota bacterium]
MWRLNIILIIFLSIGFNLVGEDVSLKFIQKLTVKNNNGTFEISFSVNKFTDIAVFIENEKGNIIRHLVAGVLGKNAPAPLKSDSLKQMIVWDGKADYGKPAGSGPFKVRVALKTGVSYDKVLIRDEQELNHIKGLAVGPDGTVYVLDAPGGAVWKGEQIIAFDRNGKYKKSVMPFASGMKMVRQAKLGASCWV